ncbi:uncharacterized protein LOC113674817 isoform X1 [Pocillopora damicornis]|uniref:uncharacterized protein LOC113674817 isoform X1 n=2 Tax=Pocillopora TaxID=46730 RepID=UPI000F54F78A|nr:uncharacterized protein LOC113674817 isoform X1 [Pocillopora damicornis]
MYVTNFCLSTDFNSAIMTASRKIGVLILIFSMSLLLTSVRANNCETELLHRCISRYRELVKEKPNNEQHCTRVQGVVDCFAENPSCQGQSINRFRLWILQEAMLEVKLKVCPRVNHEGLKDTSEKTGAAAGYMLVENLDQDDFFNSCAVQVHRTCSKKFLDLMKENQRICRDSVEWFACYKTKASEINCNSPIIKQYSNFVEKVGIQLVSDALFANSCNAEL